MSNKRTADFRIIPSDAVEMIISDNSIKILFGIEEQPGDVTDQVGVFLTPKTLKLLCFLGSQAVEAIEKMSGSEIVLNPEKISSIR